MARAIADEVIHEHRVSYFGGGWRLRSLQSPNRFLISAALGSLLGAGWLLFHESAPPILIPEK